MNKRRILLFSMAFISIIILVFLYYYIQSKDHLPKGISKGNGRLEMTRIDIATLYPGKIEAIFVKEGDAVQRNDVVAKIKNPDLQSQIAVVEAAKNRAINTQTRIKAQYQAEQQKYAIAKLDYNNALKLKQDALISDTEFKKRQAQYEAEKSVLNAVSASIKETESAIAEAQAQLQRILSIDEDLDLNAPISGTIEYRLFEPGSVIPAGARILTLLNPEDIYIYLFLPISGIGELKIGADARIIVDGIDAVFPAKVSFIANKAQFTPKQVETQSEREKMMYRVKLSIPTDIALKYAPLLKSGLTADAYVSTHDNTKWPDFLTQKLP